MKIRKKDITLICPCNDGESKTIIDIAKKLRIDTRISKQEWGARIDKEPKSNLKNLKKIIIIVEMPSPKLENQLKKEGHIVKIIDHHKYGKLDRTNKSSSLEQFADFIDFKLSRFQKGIAFNDRGYIYLLKEKKYSIKEIKKIRKFDLKTQMKSQNLNFQKIKKISVKAKKEAILKNNILIVNLPIIYNMYFMDLIRLENINKKQNLLTISKVNGKIRLIQFFGKPLLVKKLHRKFGGFMGGDLNVEGFWGIKKNINLNKIMNFLKLK